MTSLNIKLWIGPAIAAVGLCIAGCGGGGGGGVSTAQSTGPIITAVRADLPAGFGFKGGNVTLSASVVDNTAIEVVRARVYKDGAIIATPELTLTSGTTYSAVYAAPGNTTARARSYSVRVWAQDASSKYAESGSTANFSVPAAGENPPPAPGM